MTVLGERRVADFSRKYAHSRKPLSFIDIVRAAKWRYTADVKETLSTTDYDRDSETYIFDIGGNKYRLRAAIDFEEQMFSVESVMTHEQYDRR
jgi:mRNA interferase HigB